MPIVNAGNKNVSSGIVKLSNHKIPPVANSLVVVSACRIILLIVIKKVINAGICIKIGLKNNGKKRTSCFFLMACNVCRYIFILLNVRCPFVFSHSLLAF